MPRVAFVTGGSGFLGRHVVEHLRLAGWTVVALHRPTSRVDHLRALGARLEVGSITDGQSLLRAMPEGCDAVFHVAGNTSFWSADRAQQSLENVAGTRLVVEAALARRARVLVHTSSESAWGEQRATAFDETFPSNALESTVNYERTKYLGELEVEQGVARGLRACILCPGRLLGKYDTTQWASLILLVHRGRLRVGLPGGGTWSHVGEVARAHLAAVDQGRSGERYLLGGPFATYLEVLRIVGTLTGKRVPTRAMPGWLLSGVGHLSEWASFFTRGAPMISAQAAVALNRAPTHSSSDKAVRELGYRLVPLEEMLREAWEWLRGEGLLTG